MKNVYLLPISILFTFGVHFTKAQTSNPESESFFKVWNDKQKGVTPRLNALAGFIWNVHLFDDSDSAFFYIDLLLGEAEEHKLPTQLITGYNLMGIAYDFRGNIAKSIDYYTKSLTLSEEIKDNRGIAMASNNIGLIYAQQEDFEEAIAYYEKSAALKKKLKDSTGLVKSYNNIGLSYVELNQYDLALDYYEKGLSLSEKINKPAEIALVLHNLGRLYYLKKDYQKAKAFMLRALDYEEQLNSKYGISIALISLSLVYNEEGDFKKAISIGERGLALAKEVEGIDEIRDGAKALWDIYKKQSRFKESLAMYELYVNVRDSILQEDNKREILQAEFQYKFDKEQSLKKAEYDAELEKQELLAAADKKQQNVIIYSTSGGLILVVIISLLIFNRFKDTQKKNKIIQHQKEVVEEKNREITDSINYAKRIQNAILPPPKLVKEYIPDSFILYKPKDVVAGDFYWMEQKEDKILFAAADCTGHGVPGALVSVICNNGLNRSVREYNLIDPGEILDKTREVVVSEFEKSEEEVKDGMDISLCALDFNNQVLHWAGANNPLWIIRDGEIVATKSNKQPIGVVDNPLPFTTHKIALQKGDVIYVFTDGFQDQFGGESGKKFKPANFKKLLLSISAEPMAKQLEIIDNTFENWKGELEQLDDVCVIGVRV